MNKLNYKDEYQNILDELEEINQKKEQLKKRKRELEHRRKEILTDHCKYRKEAINKCSYDDTPLNDKGHCCSDCVSVGYSHIEL